MGGSGQNQDHDADDEARGVTGAGTGAAAFPVGALAGAAIGGVGGALPGDETMAANPEASGGTRERRADDGRG
jgi:hypothetical protein